MRVLRAWFNRLRGLFTRSRRERELHAELESHFQLHVDDNVRAGMTPEEARRAAVLKFGPLESVKEQYRERAHLPHVSALVQDLRYALRRWVRRPGFVVAAVLTLALGIGVTTALFSVIDAVILRPLPYPEPDRLVVVHSVRPERRHDPAFATTWDRGRLSRAMLDSLRELPAFEHVAAWLPEPRTVGDAREEIVPTLRVSSSYLPALGARILHGRHFDRQDDEVRTDSVILPHATWLRRFGGRPDVIGERVVLGNPAFPEAEEQTTHTVVAVVQAGVVYPDTEPEFILPLNDGFRRSYALLVFRGLARLAPELSRAAAASQAHAAVAGLAHAEPTTVRLSALAEDQLGGLTRPLWLLFAGAALLLLIACSNVAGLLLGEGRLRRQEMAIRSAIGGTRARILQQLTVEHLLLACAGSAVGILLAGWFTQGLVAAAPARLPRIETVTVDLRVMTFGLGLGLFTVLLFGLLPGFALSRARAADALAAGVRTASTARHFGHRIVVAIQVGLALVLLVGASLFGETMLRLTSQPLGFDPRGVAVVTTRFTGLRWGAYADAAREAFARPNFAPEVSRLQQQASSDRTDRVLGRLRGLPDVAAVAAASAAPLSGPPPTLAVRFEGRPDDETHDVVRVVVTDGYFEALQVPILDGHRDPSFAGSGSQAAVVSQSFARRFFGGKAIGRRLTHRWGSEWDQVSRFEIVGVAADVKVRGFADDDGVALYTVDRQAGSATNFIVRTSGDAAAILPSVRSAIADVDPQIVVTGAVTMEHALAASIAEERFRATLSMLFGAAALLLAGVGLYGLAARRVAERRREIGVRVAMGATPGDVRSLVFRDGLAIVTLGLLTGLPAAYAASQATQSFLFGVSPSAPHVFGLAASVLGTTAMAAMLLPAIQASRTDPTEALRTD